MLKNLCGSLLGLFCLCGLLTVVIGCGGGGIERNPDRPQTSPVKGKVLYNGSPVAGASVTFRADGAGPGAAGITNDLGEFTLTTTEPGDGAVPGAYKVSVIKSEVVGEDTSYFDDPESPNYGKEQPESAKGTVKHHIPEKYNDIETSGLTAQVSEGGPNEITLELAD